MKIQKNQPRSKGFRKYFEMEGHAFNTVSFYVCPVNPRQMSSEAPITKYIIQEDAQIKQERMEKEAEELCKILSPETEENLSFG